MNIIITGVTSFIGRAVARQLISEGSRVYGVVRPESRQKSLIPEDVTVLECDPDDYGALAQMNLPRMDACLHLAWGGTTPAERNNPEAHKKNIDNIVKLIPAIKKLDCGRLVFAGSQAEYGVQRELITEETKCSPVSEYGKAKLAVLEKAAEACTKEDMTYIHMRIFSVYGPEDNPNSLVSSCMRTFTEGGHISLGPCTKLWNFIYIDDCAKAIADLLTCPFIVSENGPLEEHVVNVGSATTRQLIEFVRIMHTIAGNGSYDNDKVFVSPEGESWLNPCIEKLQRLIGFNESYSFEEGIENVRKYYSK